MKVIKKIAAIMFALVMVISMGANVSVAHAEEEAQTGTKGKITINSAVDKQTYTIYKMLDLDYDPVNELYSYKPASNEWKTFFEEGQPGHDYATINENGYITWTDKSVANETQEEKKVRLEKEAAGLAQIALAYAKDINKGITKTKDAQAEGTTVVFSDLDLGYYLVDSSVGALCGLTTTNPNATIEEKNEIPTVTKEVFNEATGTTESNKWQDRNFANIGDTVKFQTTITTKKGAENYILHDKMDEGFTLINDSIKVKHGNTEYAKGTDYDVTFGDKKGTDENACTFHITFKEQFYKNLAVDTKVVVTYEAVLNEKAFIGHNEDNSGNKNATWLSYGDSKNTIESKTNTYTYQIPVFKYTEKNGSSFGLANAKFTLSTDENGTNKIKFVQEAAQDGYDIYRVAKKGETNTIDTIVTGENGKFKIKGIHGEFYLTEIEAPKGYNKLAKPKLIKVSELSIIFVDGTMNSGDVKILNQSGTILPSTGGIGTTIFYIAGAFLVLISGVVLIAKKRTDSK